jgi:hypothetical protein
MAASASLACGLGLASLAIAPGSAQADGPSYSGGNCPGGLTCTHWCPGDPLIPGSEFGAISWDWNICHDWYWNSVGTVDIASNIVYPWRGAPHDNGPPPPAPPPYVPPPPQPLPADCPWHSPILAPSRCGGL